LLLQAKLHQDNSFLVQNLIATFKAYHKEMIGNMVADGLSQSISGRDGESVSQKQYSFSIHIQGKTMKQYDFRQWFKTI
jgi:hypothetical protein